MSLPLLKACGILQDLAPLSRDSELPLFALNVPRTMKISAVVFVLFAYVSHRLATKASKLRFTSDILAEKKRTTQMLALHFHSCNCVLLISAVFNVYARYTRSLEL